MTLEGVAQRALFRQQAPGVEFDPMQVSEGEGEKSVQAAFVSATNSSSRANVRNIIAFFLLIIITLEKSYLHVYGVSNFLLNCRIGKN